MKPTGFETRPMKVVLTNRRPEGELRPMPVLMMTEKANGEHAGRMTVATGRAQPTNDGCGVA